MRRLFDERRTAARRRTRRRAWTTLLIGAVARVAIQLWLNSRPRERPFWPLVIPTIILNDIVNTVSLVIALNASPRSERRSFRMAASVWRRRFTNWFFRLAGIGINRETDSRPGRSDRGGAPARLAELIAPSVTERFPELPALVERLEKDQDALRVREVEVRRALAEAGGDRFATEHVSSVTPTVVPGSVAGVPTEHSLNDRRDSLLAEMRDALGEVRARRAAIGAALENVRIQLLRLGAGVGSADDMREEVDALRRLADAGHVARAAPAGLAPAPVPVRQP